MAAFSQFAKIVFLAPTLREVQLILEAETNARPSAELEESPLAGSKVFRWTLPSSEGAGQVFGASLEFDFLDVVTKLLEDSDAVVVVLPVNLARLGESRRLLGVLHRLLSKRKEGGDELTYLLQYLWPKGASSPNVEEFDAAIGVNAATVPRLLTREEQPTEPSALLALLNRLCKKKTSENT